MLIFTDRAFKTIALADTKDIPLLDDELNENIETGTAVLTATIPKAHKDVMKIEVGNYVFATDYKSEIVALEVMEIFETRHEKEIIAEDAGLDLLNDEAGPLNKKGTLAELVRETLGMVSSWEIGIDEIGNDKTLTLEYTGLSTQTKRIAQIAGRFGAEVSYSFEFRGSAVKRKLVNFHKKRGRDSGQRIEIGKGLDDIKRHISITDLCTAVRPVGKPTTKVVKVVVPWNLLKNSNRKSITKNYKVGEWQIDGEIKAGEEVTLTFKGVIPVDQQFRVYNSGSNHSLAFLEDRGSGIYTARFTWGVGNEGNKSIWAYQYPDKGAANESVQVEWAVLTRENQTADKWLPSKADESAGQSSTATGGEITPTTPPQPVTQTNNKVDKFIAWFLSKEGKVGYSQTLRQGPNYYDCSSAVSYAARHAEFVPKSFGLPNTKSLMNYGLSKRYFSEIPRSECRRGDIFVSRASDNTGHTGAFLSNSTIIHVSVGGGKRGCFRSPATNAWFGKGTRKFFRWNELLNAPAPTKVSTRSTESESTPAPASTSAGNYWSNSTIIYHDLGKTLQGITAEQLNNWVKAKVPSSPFNGQGSVFLEAQKQSGLDARYILAHAAHESNWGRHRYGYEDHNYFGIGAYDNNPDNAKKYGSASLANGIIWGANWIAENYYNGKYKQTTLDKMRNNNGVHQYATDPKWHTKIANIMKGSERFTKASAVVTPPEIATGNTDKVATGQLVNVPDVKYEDKTIDVDTTLVGYEYSDDRYVVNPAGEICDKQGLEQWGRFKGEGAETAGYILRVYESEAQTQQALFQEGLRYLKAHNEPKVMYDIDLSYLPEGIETGDTVRIIDHDYQPPLYLEARAIDITRSKTNKKSNKAVFSNFVEKESGILDRVLSLQDQAKSIRWELENQPFEMSISSSAGGTFKDGIITTDLRANLTRGGIDQTSAVDSFVWERVSEYPDKTVIADETWNVSKLGTANNILRITNADVDLQATFTCSAMVDGVAVASAAYTIKDLTIGIFKQQEEPDRSLLSWGDVWQWDNGTEHFKRIWKGDRWENTVTKRDLEMLEFTQGPPGTDGRYGMNIGVDNTGKAIYVHFAYAESIDGVVGFTTTATEEKTYIGMYVDDTETDSNNPATYLWSEYISDGRSIQGKGGEYFHYAYANSEDGTLGFSTSDKTDKVYIGTYVDTRAEDSSDPAKYDWMPIRTGDVRDGKTSYVHIAYADSANGATGFTTTHDVGKKFIGFYTDFTQQGSQDYRDYKWSLFKGEDGLPGEAGDNGLTPYLHIAYATSPNGDKGFSVSDSTGKSYIGTYTDYVVADSTNPADYTWVRIKGEDGKTGQLGRNLLSESNVPVTTTDYLIGTWGITEDLKAGEIVTITVKTPAQIAKTLSVANTLELATLMRDTSTGHYSATFPWIVGNPNNELYLYTTGVFLSADEYAELVLTDTLDPKVTYHIVENTGSTVEDPPISVDWITLQRGDIPALDWVANTDEIRDIIDEKADNTTVSDLAGKYQDLVVHYGQLPPTEEIHSSILEIEKQKGALRSLEEAIHGDNIKLEDRLVIIEDNIGAGMLSIEAITTYFNFQDEGLIIGKSDNNIRMRLINDALEIRNGDKVIARFGHNQTDTPNLKVHGTLEKGYHVEFKMDIGTKRYTVTAPV